VTALPAWALEEARKICFSHNEGTARPCECATIAAALLAAEARNRECTTCGGVPPASGRLCVCGGTNTIYAEVDGLRQECMNRAIRLGEYPNISAGEIAEAEARGREAGLVVLDALVTRLEDVQSEEEASIHFDGDPEPDYPWRKELLAGLSALGRNARPTVIRADRALRRAAPKEGK